MAVYTIVSSSQSPKNKKREKFKAGLLTHDHPTLSPSRIESYTVVFSFRHIYSCGDSSGFTPDSLFSHHWHLGL